MDLSCSMSNSRKQVSVLKYRTIRVLSRQISITGRTRQNRGILISNLVRKKRNTGLQLTLNVIHYYNPN